MKRSELHYDGIGINGPDEYRTRVATFSAPAIANDLHSKYGPLFEAAPDLLRALRMIVFQINQGNPGAVFERDACITQAREVLKKLEASNAAHS